MIDAELRALCVVAVRNELFKRMTVLMNQAKATVGHDDYDPQVFYDVHSFGDDTVSKKDFNVYCGWRNPDSLYGPDFLHTCGHRNLVDALEDERATEVWMSGSKIFEKIDGEWRFVQ